MSINPGDIRTVYTTSPFVNAGDTPTDPTTVRVRWKVHGGTETVWTYGTDSQVVKDGTGLYHADIPVDEVGLYYYRIEGTGTVQAAEEGTFLSESPFFTATDDGTAIGPAGLTIKDEGVDRGTVTALDFVGAGVTATKAGNTGTVTVSSTGGGAGTLTDPGNAWEPNVAVVEGFRIAEPMQGALRVFEVTVAGTTDAGSAWTDYTNAGSLTPLGTTITGSETWQYLGVVGELPWDIVPLAGMGVDGDGFHVDAANPVSEAATMFQLFPSLGDPGNSWQAGASLSANDRISVTVGGALRVFEATGLGTTGGSEPTWLFGSVGQTTSDGGAAWTYRGIVGGPDSSRPVFIANTAGDADWFLDLNNGSGFRFNFATDGVPEPSAGSVEVTPDGFKVNAPGGGRFFVNLDPFFVEMLGLPTTDPGAGHAGQLYSNGVPSAGVPKALMVSGG